MKRRRPRFQLNYRQHLALALLLVFLLAVSLLYCLGFASLALHQAWETQPLPWNNADLPGEDVDVTPVPPLTEPAIQGSPAP